MQEKPYLIHALSPLHAGTGQAADVIDLPIARMRSTGIPILPGSSVKGVLRDYYSNLEKDDEDHPKKVKAVFGPDTENASDHAGALVVGDARLLALPVRSFKGTFAWVTSPLLLTLAKRDLGNDLAVPAISGRRALVPAGCINKHSDNKVYLEDLDLPTIDDVGNKLQDWIVLLKNSLFPNDDLFSKRFVMVDDETMTFLWETATQLDTRIRLDSKTRTVAKGALWTEESLPPETIMIGLMAADRSRGGIKMTPEEVLNFVLEDESALQFGGKGTVGRGRCRLVPVRR